MKKVIENFMVFVVIAGILVASGDSKTIWPWNVVIGIAMFALPVVVMLLKGEEDEKNDILS